MSKNPSLRTPLPGRVNCASCHEENVEGCEKCRRCAGNCGCICRRCGYCRETHPTTWRCSVCRECRKVCQCRKAPKVMRMQMPVGVSFKENPLRRWIGLEVELNPRHRRLEPAPEWLTWNWVHDGSLQAGGEEMVVNPLVGDWFPQGVRWLGEQWRKWGSGVDQYCGLHVHVEAETAGALELRRLLHVYLLVEREIYKYFLTPDREASRFCKPWYVEIPRAERSVEEFIGDFWERRTPSEIREAFIEVLYTRTGQKSERIVQKNTREVKTQWFGMPGVRAHKYEQCRYLGLNLHTWFQRRTVEWRHHQGTVDPEEIINWGLLCGWIVEMAFQLRDEEVRGLRGLKDLLMGVWKHEGGRVYMVPQGVSEWAMGRMAQ